MFNYIISFLPKKSYSFTSVRPISPFSKEYRLGYNNAWINNIKDYTP